MVKHILEVFRQHLDQRAAARKHQGLQAGLDCQPRDAVGLRARRCTQAEIGVDHWRVPQQHVFLAAGRTAFGDAGDRCFDQRLRVLAGVADGGRAQDELRADTIERTHALQPADDVGHVRAEHAAIGVHLVDHHITQAFEELRPLGVMRQDRLVQHVRIADHHIAVQTDRLAGVAGRVAIKRERLDAKIAGLVQLQQFGHLVLGQRLGGKQVQRLGVLPQGRGKHRQRVAQRFARRRGRDDGDVFARLACRPRPGLMAVQLRDATPAQRRGQRRWQIVRQWRECSGVCGYDKRPGDPCRVTLRQAPRQCLAITRPVQHGSIGGLMAIG